MSELDDRMELARTSLAAAAPARVVTRKYKVLHNLPAEELAVGQFCVVSKGEKGYKNFNGREAMDGEHDILVIGRFQLQEDADGLLIEREEFAMIEELKAWVKTLEQPLCCLVMTGFAQSGQLEAPYGWILAQFVFQGDE